MCKEMPVILVNRAVDAKRKIGKLEDRGQKKIVESFLSLSKNAATLCSIWPRMNDPALEARSSGFVQGCQLVYLHTKIPIYVYFGGGL
jgi:hypothetical protein